MVFVDAELNPASWEAVPAAGWRTSVVLGDVEFKSRDLGNDRGYSVARAAGRGAGKLAALLGSFCRIDGGNGFEIRTLVWVRLGGLGNAGWELKLNPHPLTAEGAAPKGRIVVRLVGGVGRRAWKLGLE
jgi:hypothetical protein